MVIKKKALDLLYKICNHSNVKSIVKELINFLLAAENEFKEELANKICLASEKFHMNKVWHIDTVVKVLTLAGNSVREEFIYNLIQLVGSNQDIQSYAVTKVYFAMKENMNQYGLVLLTVWLVGEYGEILTNGTAVSADNTPIQVEEEEIMDQFEKVVEMYVKKSEQGDRVICFLLNALSKLSIRFKNSESRIQELIEAHSDSINVEIQ
jgi:AP-1 complex subunit gamma-1